MPKAGAGAAAGGAAGFTSRVKAYQSAEGQSIPNAALTKVTLDAESYDGLGEFDPVTNYRFTAQVAGYYAVTARINCQAGVDLALYDLRLMISGGLGVISKYTASGTNTFSYGLTDIVYLAAAAYLELFIYQTSGAAMLLNAGEYYTYFSIHRLS